MRARDKAQNVVRASMGTPFALRDACVDLYAAAFPLKKVEHEIGEKVVCESCRKKRLGAKYVVEKKTP